MAHWPVPRLRGLHPSMTKFDGALRSDCRRSLLRDELTLSATKPTFAPVSGTTVTVDDRPVTGRPHCSGVVSGRGRPAPPDTADPDRPHAVTQLCQFTSQERAFLRTVGPANACRPPFSIAIALKAASRGKCLRAPVAETPPAEKAAALPASSWSVTHRCG